MSENSSSTTNTAAADNTVTDSIVMHGDKSYYSWTKNIHGDTGAAPELVKKEQLPGDDALTPEQKHAQRLAKSHKLTKFSWFDSDDRVKVHCDLPGVKQFKATIETKFTADSFDVFVPDYVAPNSSSSATGPSSSSSTSSSSNSSSIPNTGDLRLWIVELASPIDPAESKLIVKPDKLIVSLKKQDPSVHWYALRSDKRTRPPGSKVTFDS